MTANAEPWVHVGEPAAPTLAGFGWELPGLVPDQAAALRSMELVERAEEVERQERVAERADAAHNMAVAMSMSRARAAGERWDPANPLKHYPPIGHRIDQAFAMMDTQAAADLRQAKRAAAKVLRDHGISAQVLVDANHPAPGGDHPGPVSSLPGDSASTGTGAPGETSARSRRAKIRALLRHRDENPPVKHPLAADGREITGRYR